MTAEHYLKEGVDKVSENKIATTCSHTGQQSEEVDIKIGRASCRERVSWTV